MFPIRDHNPSERTPYVLYALIAVNVLVFLVQLPHMSSERALMVFWADRALYPVAVTKYGDYTGIFTSMFLHAGWLHIGGNMLFLWIFGDNIEDQFGHVGFLVFYLVCGVIAALAQIAANPGSTVPTVGASGAIGGVLGGYLLLFPRAKVDVLLIIIIFFRIFTLPAWIILGLWFVLQVFAGLGSPTTGGGVAHWAHIGGFIAGILLTVPIWLHRGGAAFWLRNQGRPPNPEAEYSASNIPRVRRRKR